jgi:predicted HicB family RNase H-like nuclease
VSSYILRKIDPDLWKQVKSKAALEPVSLKTLIERLLRAWLETP